MGDVFRGLSARGLLLGWLVTLAGCGGGGDDGLLMSASLSPSAIAATFYPMDAPEFPVQATVRGDVSGVVVIIETNQHLLKRDVLVAPLGGDLYRVIFKAESYINTGRSQGQLNLRICSTPSCTRVYGSPSLSYDFNVLPYPVPVVGGIAPAAAAVGSAGFDLTVTGNGFTRGSAVYWDDTALPTTYISSTQLMAIVSDTHLAQAKVVPVTVRNPVPGGGTSAARNFSVTYPEPFLKGLSAVEATTGCNRFVLRAAGEGFVSATTLLWNGSPRATTLLSPTLLAAEITAADVAGAGAATVAVRNPTPGGGTTANQSFSIKNGGPATTDSVSFHINAQHTGRATTRCPVNLPASRSWRFTLSNPTSYPLVAEGKVYFVELGGGQPLHALNAASGTVAWGPLATSESFAGNPAYDNGRLFIAGSQSIKSYNAANGNLAWQKPVDQNVISGIAATDGTLYFATVNGSSRVEALDQSNGLTKWTRTIQGGYDSVPAVNAGGIYLASPCFSYRLSLADGGVNWQSGSSCSTGNVGGGTPVLGDQRLFAPRATSYGGQMLNVGNGSSLGGFSADTIIALAPGYQVALQGGTLRATADNGTRLWTFAGEEGDPPVSAPILVNNLVFVGTLKQRVWALDARNGTPLWSAELGGEMAAPPAVGVAESTGLSVGGGRLVVPTVGGLSAFDLGGRE